MTLKRAIGAAFAAGVFVTMPVLATDFDSLDKNKDGGLDPTEAQAVPGLKEKFSKYDHDKSGKLGKDEFAEALRTERLAQGSAAGAAGASSDPSRYFDSLDKNNDGKLDPTEAQAVPGLNFSKYDHDKNGTLGKDEFAEALRALRGPSAAAGASGDASRYFDSLDKNNDGKLDPTEAQAVPGLQQSFSKYDHDKNGTLGKDEFAEALRAVGGPSAAAGGTAGPKPDFDTLDKNNDGGLDPSEIGSIPWLQKDFSKYDLDRSGKLGKDEFGAAWSQQPR